MDAAKVSAAVVGFARDHKITLEFLGNRQTQLLEVGATVGVVQHYRSQGYETEICNPKGESSFRLKLGTAGHPADYSRVLCKRDGSGVCEIHSNLSVRGAHDQGVYCVDVAVVEPETVPSTKGKTKWLAIDNCKLITFAEVKKLVVYPMLLAQFVGIVHEILPHCVRRSRRRLHSSQHLEPTLIALGHLSGNSDVILRSFRKRKYVVRVAESFDLRLAMVRKSTDQSPFGSLASLFQQAEDQDK